MDKAAGWKLLYAVDADVVLMYTSPQRSLGYGRVFDSDTERTNLFLVNLLSDAIFFPDPGEGEDPKAQGTLFVIPPHDGELNNVMQSVAWNAGEGLKGLAAKGTEHYEELFNLISSYSGEEPEKLALKLKGHAKELLDLSKRITGSLTTMDRFMKLSDKLLNIWNAKIDGQYLLDWDGSGIQFETVAARRKWYQDLIATRDKQKNFGRERTSDIWSREKEAEEDKADADAQVLATLDYVNDMLFAKKIKVLLITGTSSVMEVGRKYLPANADKTSSKLSFTEQYIRHPHWIMSDEHFFDFIRGDVAKWEVATLDRWLKILSPEGSLEKDKPDSPFERGELEKIPETWSNLVETMTTAKYGSESVGAGFDSRGEGELILRLKELASADNLNKQSFLELFEAPVTESISRLYLSSALIGLLESAAVTTKPSRLMPALVFDPPYREYNRYYAELIELFDPSLESAVRRDKIAQIRDLNKSINSAPFDPSLYHSHIIHAAAFAAIDFWEPATTLCMIAVRIANSLVKDDRDGHEQRRGREASYLAAVLARRKAKRREDLSVARDRLRQAELREEASREVKDIRFVSELLVLDLRELYFRFFVPDGSAAMGQQEFIEKITRKILDLREVASEVHTHHLPYEDEETRLRVKAWVERQALTNLFEAAIILYSLGSRLIFDLAGEFKVFDESISSSDEKRDPHAWLVSRIAGLVLRIDNSRTSLLSANAITRYIGRSEQTASYESKRNDAFRSALEKSAR